MFFHQIQTLKKEDEIHLISTQITSLFLKSITRTMIGISGEKTVKY